MENNEATPVQAEQPTEAAPTNVEAASSEVVAETKSNEETGSSATELAIENTTPSATSIKTEIVGYETKSDSVTYYKVATSVDNATFESERRYTHFIELHSALRNRYPSIAQFAPPPKAYLLTNTVTTKEHRKERFSQFLNVVATLSNDLPSEVKVFLNLEAASANGSPAVTSEVAPANAPEPTIDNSKLASEESVVAPEVEEQSVTIQVVATEEPSSEPAPVTEPAVSEPAPVDKQIVRESSPVAELAIGLPAPTAEAPAPAIETSTVIDEPASEPTPIAEDVVSDVAPVAVETTNEPAPATEDPVSETTPAVEESTSEPVDSTEERASESAAAAAAEESTAAVATNGGDDKKKKKNNRRRK